MLKGCEIYITGAPCRDMHERDLLVAHRSRGVFCRLTLTDTSAIGFDDAYQHEDFAKPWDKTADRGIGSFRARSRSQGLQGWTDKEGSPSVLSDRHGDCGASWSRRCNGARALPRAIPPWAREWRPLAGPCMLHNGDRITPSRRVRLSGRRSIGSRGIIVWRSS